LGSPTRLEFKRCRRGEDLRRVGDVHEVNNIAGVDDERDVGDRERFVGEVNGLRDGECTVEEGRVGVGNGDGDRVGISLVELPGYGVRGVLDPVRVRRRTSDGNGSKSLRHDGEKTRQGDSSSVEEHV